MMRPSSEVAVYMCRSPVDFHKATNGLVLIFREELALDPYGESPFVFINRACNLIKILHWGCNGLCLWMMRLEKHKFMWPLSHDTATVSLTAQKLK